MSSAQELGTIRAMAFEDELAALNEWHFFREFTYSKSTFRPAPSQEVELADSIIWIGNLLVVYQLKEREAQGATTVEAEKRWFERKVLRQATRQVRDTLLETTRLMWPENPWLLDEPLYALGKEVCHDPNPNCSDCYLRRECTFYKTN